MIICHKSSSIYSNQHNYHYFFVSLLNTVTSLYSTLHFELFNFLLISLINNHFFLLLIVQGTHIKSSTVIIVQTIRAQFISLVEFVHHYTLSNDLARQCSINHPATINNHHQYFITSSQAHYTL